MTTTKFPRWVTTDGARWWRCTCCWPFVFYNAADAARCGNCDAPRPADDADLLARRSDDAAR